MEQSLGLNKKSSQSDTPSVKKKPLRVGIIGAGVSGLTTLKACLEAGLEADVYEHTSELGGVWRFRPEVENHIGSVMHCTIVNSSKEMTAFSDFPVPDEYPNFMPNKLMVSVSYQLVCSYLIFDFSSRSNTSNLTLGNFLSLITSVSGILSNLFSHPIMVSYFE